MTPFQEEVVNNVFLMVVMLVYHFAVTLSQDTVAPSQDVVALPTIQVDDHFNCSNLFRGNQLNVTNITNGTATAKLTYMGEEYIITAETGLMASIFHDSYYKNKFVQLLNSSDLLSKGKSHYNLVYDNTNFHKFLIE